MEVVLVLDEFDKMAELIETSFHVYTNQDTIVIEEMGIEDPRAPTFANKPNL